MQCPRGGIKLDGVNHVQRGQQLIPSVLDEVDLQRKKRMAIMLAFLHSFILIKIARRHRTGSKKKKVGRIVRLIDERESILTTRKSFFRK